MSSAILALVTDPSDRATDGTTDPTRSSPTRSSPTPSDPADVGPTGGHRLRIEPAPSPWPAARPAARPFQIPDGAARQGELDLELACSSGLAGAPKPVLRRVDRLSEPERTAIRTPGRSTRSELDDLGEESQDDFGNRRPTPTRELPDPMTWSARLAQAIVEIRAGLRSPQQVTRWTTTAVLSDLRRAYSSARDRSPTSVRVQSVHAGQPADGVVEATAVVSRGSRCRALALRLEGWDGKWVCVSADVI